LIADKSIDKSVNSCYTTVSKMNKGYIMYAGKKSSLLQWEKVLKVMVSGKAVSKEVLEKMPEMEDVPLYRMSSFIYHIKLAGGVVRAIKDGRKIVQYELANINDMVKYLEKREKSFSSKSSAKNVAAKVAKLSDLDAEVQQAEVSADEMEVVEITESVE
jgi:hypothetical protein